MPDPLRARVLALADTWEAEADGIETLDRDFETAERFTLRECVKELRQVVAETAETG